MNMIRSLALGSAMLAAGALATTMTTTAFAQEIERKGEGRHFYTTIRVPANAEFMYLSGAGASRQEDGTWGDMEQQTIDTFNGFKEKLEAEGWSMSDIIQVRAFGVADEAGNLDFDGFNRAYRQFFGTDRLCIHDRHGRPHQLGAASCRRPGHRHATEG